LDDTSDTFARPNGDGSSHYYYEAIQLTISTISYYSLTSISLIDTYGCLYSSSFDPSNPTYNLIICDDDSAGSRQFLINQYLNSYTTYILVVTTFSALTLGSFTVQATGPASVGMTSISPSSKAFKSKCLFFIKNVRFYLIRFKWYMECLRNSCSCCCMQHCFLDHSCCMCMST